MRPIVVILAPVVDADGIALSQTTPGAQDLILNGAFVEDGVAVLAAAQQVSLTSAGNLSGVNFLIVGTDQNGRDISEIIVGPNVSTVQTTNYFLTVTQITSDAAVASAVEVGSAAQTSSATLPINWREHNFTLGMFIELSSAAVMNYTAQFTPDNTQKTFDPSWHDTVDLTALSTSPAAGNIVVSVDSVRLIINSFTSGTAKFTVRQGGN